MNLLCSPASPYSSKVRMAARYLGMEITEVQVDSNAGTPILIENNPLGKIPTLLTDDGVSVFDSIAIMHYFDRLKGRTLYPVNDAKRTTADILESLCDGICDSLLAIVYERRFRDEEKVHQPWIDRQWSKVVRSLDHINANPPKLEENLTGGDFALAATLGYLDLRFKGQWEAGRAALADWVQAFETRFPDYAELKPQA
ncbi:MULTISPECIES: glutathione S-transferase family protein [unclassified Sinorhizobium]|uniref:glutathione S-transferase family protein n=1 Tax=unclassified Sinorhizobium TaxID=2613772 RepID=UPI0035257D67